MPGVKLEIETVEDAQRLRCPNGHASIGPTNEHWWCKSCAAHWDDVEAEFDYVVDAKTGERYGRGQVDIDDEVPGCYYA